MRNLIFFVKSKDNCRCPECRSPLVHRDYKKRIMRSEGGETKFIHIERLKCTRCARLHNALPDFLVPYKHYAAEVVSGVIEGVITSDDLDDEDYPCEATMRHWHHWEMMGFRH